MSFTLHPDLQRDGIPMGEFALCQVLLINDATYPWFVMVPKRGDISDTIDLTDVDHAQLWAESKLFSAAIMTAFDGEKLNVAALGNMTPQLHIHHIVRYKSDPAWPGPIWGKLPMVAYKPSSIEAVKAKLSEQNIEGFTPV
ncbi:HIT domain-containing protein [Fretibacter rubidus]|uniref:HIT domain-containing protein n=1 Tax=Fretibacter rubidus TaxID=570162 RepID=UPI00352A1B7D